MVVALVGGVLPAVVAVVGGFLLANWYFTPPFYELDDRRRREPARPRRLRRRRRHRRRARRPRRAQPAAGRPRCRPRPRRWPSLAGVAGPARLGRPRCSASCAATFGVPRRRPARGATAAAGTCSSASGAEPPTRARATPTSAATSAAASRSPSPAARCRREDQRVLNAFAAQVAAAAERERLHGEAGKAADLAAANTLRAVAAAGRVARPAHAAGVDQGVDLQPAPARHRLAARRRRRVPGDDRGGDRPADRPRRQPARHEPAAGVGADGRRCARSASRRSCSPPSPASAPARRDVDVDVPETLPDVVADAALLERALANLDRQRRPRARRPTRRRGSTAGEVVARRPAPRRHPRHRPRPGHPRRPTASWCSSRSSGSSTTRPTAPASASGWRSPAASSRRWAASWRSRTPRAAARRWSSACPVADGRRAPT